VNIFFVLNNFSQFMIESRKAHWVVLKHVLSYLRGTIEFGLRYVRVDGMRLHGYSDSDWAGNAVYKKITSHGCFNLGSVVASWFQRKNTFIALSSVEAEYMETSLASCEAICLCNLLAVLFGTVLELLMIAAS
jgi:hypothetical protein